MKKFWNSVSCAAIALALLLTLSAVPASAQDVRFAPEWWFGGALGLNYSMYGGSTQVMNSALAAPRPFSGGKGLGLYLAPMLEYRPDPVWGGMLALGFDSRRGSFDDVTAAGVTQTLSTSMNYLALEPSLRITPFTSNNLYFFAGPRIGFNVAKSFSYTQTASPSVDAEWSAVRGTVLTAQIGAGIDIPLSDPDANLQTELSPFLSFHFGQGPRSAEDWSLSGLRAGVALKFGTSTELHQQLSSDLQFSLRAPKVIPGERRVRETFPLRNYVFFDMGSAQIPARYTQLTADQAASFREENLVQPEPKDLSGRALRQMTVYHHNLNVIGDRLRRYPDATVTVTGAAPEGVERARAQAQSVKKYFIDVFGISADRITVDGRLKPEHPSWQPGGTRELDLVQAEDRRVEITSSTPEILQPIQIISLQEDPLSNDVIFTVGGDNILASWNLELTDKSGGIVKRYGPFTTGEERISGKQILADNQNGTYDVVLLAQTKSGQTIRKTEPLRLAKSDTPEDSLGVRFSILFEFDESKTVSTYQKFLTGTVAPLIPAGGSVIIHGHTDNIGEESHNLKLSQDRAHETQRILEGELGRLGKRNVQFDAYGFGEDARRSPFDNNFPEERFYNRTVVIDIQPEQ